MNKIKIISIASAAVMVCSATTVGLISSSAVETVTPATTSACDYYNTHNEGKALTICVSTEWQMDNARFTAYFFNERTGKGEFKDLEKNGRATVNHSVTVPGNYTHVIFLRLAQNAPNDFELAWNKTIALRISDLPDDTYRISGWELNA